MIDLNIIIFLIRKYYKSFIALLLFGFILYLLIPIIKYQTEVWKGKQNFYHQYYK